MTKVKRQKQKKTKKQMANPPMLLVSSRFLSFFILKVLIVLMTFISVRLVLTLIASDHV